MTLFEHIADTVEERCRCGHHEGSHTSGFSLRGCLWCGCQMADLDGLNAAELRQPGWHREEMRSALRGQALP